MRVIGSGDLLTECGQGNRHCQVEDVSFVLYVPQEELHTLLRVACLSVNRA